MRSTVRRIESTAVETLPPPPPTPPAEPDASVRAPERIHHIPRPGDLTTGWLILTGIGWMGVVVVLASAWSVSRQLGLSTWWLGPIQHQRPLYVMLLPFVAPAVVITAAGNRVRYVPWIGVLGAAATAAVGVGDLGRVVGIGVVELIAAAAALLISIASFSRMFRAVGSTDGPVDDNADGSAVTDGSDRDDGVDSVLPAGEPAPG
jgi:hypothetical protein